MAVLKNSRHFMPIQSSLERFSRVPLSGRGETTRSSSDGTTYFGIEIESEGVPNFSPLRNTYWRTTRDGSLRGLNPVECVSYPMQRHVLEDALYDYEGYLRALAIPPAVAYSWRCGTHIHMNLLDLEHRALAALILTSFAADNYFYAAGDEARRNNYNCRPSSLLIPTAEFLGTLARYATKAHFGKMLRHLSGSETPDHRYVGMNWHSLKKFGTVELRHFPGTFRSSDILRWVDMAQAMYTFAAQRTVQEVRDLIYEGASEFGRQVFGDLWDRVAYPGHTNDWVEVLDGVDHFMACYSNRAESSKTLHGILHKNMVL